MHLYLEQNIDQRSGKSYSHGAFTFFIFNGLRKFLISKKEQTNKIMTEINLQWLSLSCGLQTQLLSVC